MSMVLGCVIIGVITVARFARSGLYMFTITVAGFIDAMNVGAGERAFIRVVPGWTYYIEMKCTSICFV
ncbi:unnamed protein product [Cuscuta campestris]|nr:unnamed protein product [Cuscuta campestris]